MSWKEWVNTPTRLATTLGIVGLPLSAIVIAIAGYYSFENRLGNVEKNIERLSTPQSARAKMCETAVERLVSVSSSDFSNARAEVRLEQLIDRLGCYELVTFQVGNAANAQ